MLSDILNLFSSVFSGVFGILNSFFQAIPGSMELYIAFFFMFMVVRFVIKPFTGMRGRSDNAAGGNKDNVS